MGSSGSVEKKKQENEECKLDSIAPATKDHDALRKASAPELRTALKALRASHDEELNNCEVLRKQVVNLESIIIGLKEANATLVEENNKLRSDAAIPSPSSQTGATTSPSAQNLERKPSMQAKVKERAAALCASAHESDLGELQRLLESGIEVNTTDYDQRTALHVACDEGNIEVVEALLEAGADVNLKDRWGTTPLKAALTNVHNDVANLMKDHGAVVEEKVLRSHSAITSIFQERGRQFRSLLDSMESVCKLPSQSSIPLPALCLYLYTEYGVNVSANKVVFDSIVDIAEVPETVSPNLGKWGVRKSCLATFHDIDKTPCVGPIFETIISSLEAIDKLASVITRDALKTAMAGSEMSDLPSLCKLGMGQGAITNWGAFTKVLTELCQEVMLGPNEGSNATYIPDLAEGVVDPDLFSVSVCTVEGQQFVFGDEEKFTLQSCSKPILYAAAMEEHGEEKVHNYVGKEPSGRTFDNFEMADGKPFNPVTNAGSLVTCSLYQDDEPNTTRLESFLELVKDLAGDQDVTLNNKVYKSEQSTAYKNYAIANLLQAEGCFPEHIKKHEDLAKEVEFYLRSCSVAMNSRTCATIAATFANWGTNPLTGKKILGWETVRNTLQVCYSCGLYNGSGNWACTVGLPAKSGVSGVIYVVVPGVLGLCVRSPRIDGSGNSVRGQIFARRFAERFRWSVLDLTYRAKDQMAMAL